LIAPVIFFAISASILYVVRAQSYGFYQRIQFESAGATMYANLYHPSKSLEFQVDHPLVIYTHGSGWQKDVDIRNALELTKRGFFVASIDYQGHGESGGDFVNIDPETNMIGAAQDCSKLLDAIEQLDVYKDHINPAQIGLVGHSLGGLVVLMNGIFDNRFSATVSWAGVVNSSYGGSDEFSKFNPANLMNETRPKNLLIIHAFDDRTVSYESHALVAQQLTGATIINVTDSLFSAHYLISDTVMIETINWYEQVFFGSETINGPIHLTFGTTLILMVLTLIGLCSTALSIIIYTSRYFLSRSGSIVSDSIENQETSTKKNKVMLVIGFLTSTAIYLIIWILLPRFFGLSSIFIVPFLVIVCYAIYLILDKIIINKSKIDWNSYKESIKMQLNPRVIFYTLFSSAVFLGFYYIQSLAYPWVLLYPPDFIAFFLALMVFPLYISTEIFYRKLMFPSLNFIQNRKIKTLIVVVLTLFIHIYFTFLSFMYYGRPAIMGAFMMFLMATTINCVLYHKTGKFSAVLLNSFIINGLLFGSTIPVLTSLIESLL
jgi:pimeloyl-ACP methyl ester carboxylesterase